MSVKAGAAFFFFFPLKSILNICIALYIYKLLLGLHSFIGPGIYKRTAIAPNLLGDLRQVSDLSELQSLQP